MRKVKSYIRLSKRKNSRKTVSSRKLSKRKNSRKKLKTIKGKGTQLIDTKDKIWYQNNYITKGDEAYIYCVSEENNGSCTYILRIYPMENKTKKDIFENYKNMHNQFADAGLTAPLIAEIKDNEDEGKIIMKKFDIDFKSFILNLVQERKDINKIINTIYKGFEAASNLVEKGLQYGLVHGDMNTRNFLVNFNTHDNYDDSSFGFKDMVLIDFSFTTTNKDQNQIFNDLKMSFDLLRDEAVNLNNQLQSGRKVYSVPEAPRKSTAKKRQAPASVEYQYPSSSSSSSSIYYDMSPVKKPYSGLQLSPVSPQQTMRPLYPVSPQQNAKPFSYGSPQQNAKPLSPVSPQQTMRPLSPVSPQQNAKPFSYGSPQAKRKL